MNNISPKVQNQLSMLQQIQQQLQNVLQQKAQYELAVREAKRAQEEIKDSADDSVMYMSVGTIMMQKKKEVVDAKLTEKVETPRAPHQVPRKAGEDAAGPSSSSSRTRSRQQSRARAPPRLHNSFLTYSRNLRRYRSFCDTATAE